MSSDSAMYVKLYEDITQFGYIATSYHYPAGVNHPYLIGSSLIPGFDRPKMNQLIFVVQQRVI